VRVLALHDLGELDLKVLNGADGRQTVVAAETVDVELALADVGNVVVLEVKDAAGVLDHGSSVRGDKEFDGLRHAVLGEEGAGLGAAELGSDGAGTVRGTSRDAQQTTRALVRADWGSVKALGGLLTSVVLGQLDVDKVHFKLAVGLDTDEERGTTAGGNNLVGEVPRLEDKGERALLRRCQGPLLFSVGERLTSSLITVLINSVKERRLCGWLS
jgi:hypothetical protein